MNRTNAACSRHQLAFFSVGIVAFWQLHRDTSDNWISDLLHFRCQFFFRWLFVSGDSLSFHFSSFFSSIITFHQYFLLAFLGDNSTPLKALGASFIAQQYHVLIFTSLKQEAIRSFLLESRPMEFGLMKNRWNYDEVPTLSSNPRIIERSRSPDESTVKTTVTTSNNICWTQSRLLLCQDENSRLWCRTWTSKLLLSTSI